MTFSANNNYAFFPCTANTVSGHLRSHLFGQPSPRLSAWLIWPSVKQAVSPSVRLAVYLAVCPAVRPAVRPAVCPAACLAAGVTEHMYVLGYFSWI